MTNHPCTQFGRLPAIWPVMLVGLLLAGCGEDHKPPAETAKLLSAVAADAQAACDRTDVKAADAALARGEPLLAELDQIAHPPRGDSDLAPATDQDGLPADLEPDSDQAIALAAWPAAQTDMQLARDWAKLTHEKKRRDDILNSLKMWSYRQGRNLAVKGVLNGMALAAGQAQSQGFSKLPPAVQDLANQAAGLAACPTLPDGSTDWPAVTAKLNGWAAAPPLEIAWTLAAGWLSINQPKMALVEIDLAAIPPEPVTAPVPPLVPPPASAVPDSEKLSALHPPPAAPDTAVANALPAAGFDHRALIVRALIYRENEMPRLAALDEARIDRMQGVDGSRQAQELVLGIQFIIHVIRLKNALVGYDLIAADRELAELIRRAPDSPFIVVLKGERLVAEGQGDQAADNLDAWLKGHATDPESVWWAEKIQARVRVVRASVGDGQPPPPFLLDSGFLLEVADHLVRKADGWSNAPELETATTTTTAAAMRYLQQGIALVERLQLNLPATSVPDATPATAPDTALVPAPVLQPPPASDTAPPPAPANESTPAPAAEPAPAPAPGPTPIMPQ